jgi:mannose-6-phosphate isomerase-like protein (cupin superfamily)
VRPYPERRKTLNVLKEANLAWGSFDDFPVVPYGVEPSPHLSRSSTPQPFYLVTSKDEVLVTMSGEGEVQFRDPERTVMTIGPGDVVYLPARLPSRIVPHTSLWRVAPTSHTGPFRCSSERT